MHPHRRFYAKANGAPFGADIGMVALNTDDSVTIICKDGTERPPRSVDWRSSAKITKMLAAGLWKEVFPQPQTQNSVATNANPWYDSTNRKEPHRDMSINIKTGLLGYDAIDKAATLAAAAGEHMLLVGPPGRAKSLFYRKFFANLEGKFFETQLSKFSDDSALFGAPDLKEMRETGRIVYPKEGVANAEWLGIDEIFDASDITLRTLNGLLNERKVLRGHEAYNVPLQTTIATANYSRQNEIIAAVLDRFALYTVTPNITEAQRKALYNGQTFETIETPANKVSLDELTAIREKAKHVKIPDSLIQTLVRWTQSIGFTPRRERVMAKLLKVSAALRGFNEVGEKDLEVVRYVVPLSPGAASGAQQSDPSQELRDGITKALNEGKQVNMIDQFRNVKREQGDRTITYVKNLAQAIKMISDISPVTEAVQKYKDDQLQNLRQMHKEQLDALGVMA